MTFLLLTPFVPMGVQGYNFYGGEGLDESALVEQDVEQIVATMNELDGFVYKAVVEGDADRSNQTEVFPYTVRDGDTLSRIAGQFDLSVDTLLMVNNFPSTAAIRPGTILKIPPVNGVTHTVADGDTVGEIAKKYKATAADIASQNGLEEGETLSVGRVLIVPNGKIEPPKPTIIAYTNNSGGSYNNSAYSDVSYAPAAPNPNGGWVWPTSPNVVTTQRFGGYHSGVDLASKASPPIYAATDGVVEKVSVGSYGNGYGNHIIINHGNGIKTLYAHLSRVDVQKGQTLGAGEVLGIMGTTGRSTGIHLHFEVIVNGVKQNPFNYVGK